MRRRKLTKKEASKIGMYLCVITSLIDIQLCVLAPYFGIEPQTEVCVKLIEFVWGVYGAYCVKAFFGKKYEEATRLKEIELDQSTEVEEGR